MDAQKHNSDDAKPFAVKFSDKKEQNIELENCSKKPIDTWLQIKAIVAVTQKINGKSHVCQYGPDSINLMETKMVDNYI